MLEYENNSFWSVDQFSKEGLRNLAEMCPRTKSRL